MDIYVIVCKVLSALTGNDFQEEAYYSYDDALTRMHELEAMDPFAIFEIERRELFTDHDDYGEVVDDEDEASYDAGEEDYYDGE